MSTHRIANPCLRPMIVWICLVSTRSGQQPRKVYIIIYIIYIRYLLPCQRERERECAGPMRSPSSILLTTLGVDLFQLGRLWGEKSRMGVCVCATSKLNKCNMKSCKTNHPFPWSQVLIDEMAGTGWYRHIIFKFLDLAPVRWSLCNAK